MTDNETFGRVDFSVSSGFVPWGDPSEYVHTVTGMIEWEEEIETGEIVLQDSMPKWIYLFESWIA